MLVPMSLEERNRRSKLRAAKLVRIEQQPLVIAAVRAKYSIAADGTIQTARGAKGTLYRNTRLYRIDVPNVGSRQLAESTIKKMLTDSSS